MKAAAILVAVMFAAKGALEQEPSYAIASFVFICLWALLPFPENGRPY